MRTPAASEPLGCGAPSTMHDPLTPAIAGHHLRRLHGRRIAIPAARDMDRLGMMLRSHGASVLRLPFVHALEVTNHDGMEVWLKALTGPGFDEIVFLSDPGVDRLLVAAELSGRKTEVFEALRRTPKIVRGPRPAQALLRRGLVPDILAPASLEGLVEVLRTRSLGGRKVAVQTFGDDSSHAVLECLRQLGAELHPIAPSRSVISSDRNEVARTIAAFGRGYLDGVTFSAPSQVSELFEVARGEGGESRLRGGLARAHVAATSALVAGRLRELLVRVDMVPDRQFFMRRLAEGFCQRLGSNAVPTPGTAGASRH
jgi:uroporphyrinogen-III synthase